MLLMYQAYLISLLEIMRPKVVLTFVDSFQDSWLGIVVWLGFTILTVLVGVWVVRLDSEETA